jgi:murein DD-endopeptidase MepM/ murein hydrolase activator NlpD
VKKEIYFLFILSFFAYLTPVKVSHSVIDYIIVKPSKIGQGEVGILTVSVDKGGKPEIIWNEKRITLIPGIENKVWTAFIGADLTLRPGKYKLKTIAREHMDTKLIHVFKKDYGVRRLTVPKSMEALDEQTLKRVKRESRRIKKLFLRSDKNPLWKGVWVRPVNGPVVSPFGRRSIINGAERSPHSGVDLKAAEGVPVKATNNGAVVLTDDCFFGGVSVIIDHGGGIHSMYFHLSKPLVNTGQMVKKGDIIGLSGSSGRVTGPHLHFGVRLDGARINPLELIDVSRIIGAQ